MTEQDEIDPRFANTLARGLSILRAFRPSDDGLGNLEISERTGIPKSTVSRLTFTLQLLGYLSHAKRHNRYRLGPAALALGNIASASVSFVEIADGIMQQLADEASALVVLAVRDQQKMQMIKTWRPQQVSAIWLDVGHRVPIIGSASGHAYLASLSDHEFRQIAPQLLDASPRIDQQTCTDIRDEAYAQLITNGFVIAGKHRFTQAFSSVAIGFRSPEFDEPASFACGVAGETHSEECVRDTIGPALRDQVRQLEQAIGLSSALVQRG